MEYLWLFLKYAGIALIGAGAIATLLVMIGFFRWMDDGSH